MVCKPVQYIRVNGDLTTHLCLQLSAVKCRISRALDLWKDGPVVAGCSAQDSLQ